MNQASWLGKVPGPKPNPNLNGIRLSIFRFEAARRTQEASQIVALVRSGRGYGNILPQVARLNKSCKDSNIIWFPPIIKIFQLKILTVTMN